MISKHELLTKQKQAKKNKIQALTAEIDKKLQEEYKEGEVAVVSVNLSGEELEEVAAAYRKEGWKCNKVGTSLEFS